MKQLTMLELAYNKFMEKRSKQIQLREPHKAKKKAANRAKNKVARQSRKINRRKGL